MLLKPMNNPLGVSPSKGKQGTTRGKEKSFDLGGNRTHDLRIRSSVTLPTELQGRTEKVGKVYYLLGSALSFSADLQQAC